jgi:uncharacterized membrane protein YdbT with pleckstrin-like domain
VRSAIWYLVGVIPQQQGLAPMQIPTGQQAANILRAEETIYEGQPALLPNLGALLLCVITAGLALIYFALHRNGTKYRITSQRIVVDSGIFSKRLDQIDLYRVNDFQVERPFWQRIMGTGNLRLSTTDRINPQIALIGIPGDVVALYERVRVGVAAAKQAAGVRIVDNEWEGGGTAPPRA